MRVVRARLMLVRLVLQVPPPVARQWDSAAAAKAEGQ
jgi:hypothetical protein